MLTVLLKNDNVYKRYNKNIYSLNDNDLIWKMLQRI